MTTTYLRRLDTLRVLGMFALCLIASAALAAKGASPAPKKDAAPKTAEAVISDDVSKLPALVQEMRAAILNAAASGDIEALRPVLESNELMPTVSFGGDKDPIAYWKSISGDGKGYDILAAIIEVFRLPYAIVKQGADKQAMYVWPYLAQLGPKALTPPQMVDLMTLVSPKDAKAMRDEGSYLGYRGGIGADGTWHFFVAGD